jgi:hypothetical protein
MKILISRPSSAIVIPSIGRGRIPRGLTAEEAGKTSGFVSRRMKGVPRPAAEIFRISRGDAMVRIMAAALCFLLFFVAPGGALAETKEKIEIGVAENVVLLPWGVTLPARIDTGASVSSLDARQLTVKGETVEFTLPEQYGGQAIRLPIVRWITVRSAAAKDRRPVVMMELCIGPKRIRTEVNLNDRSNVKHPLLIGRNTLKHGFIVACDASYCAKPSCPEVRTK